MAFRFFQIPARGCDLSEGDLNRFLDGHRVLAVDRRWVDQGENSYWAVCVDYLESPSGTSTAGSPATQRNRIDYREVLGPEQFAAFAALRDFRKGLAAEDGVPIYTVFTNAQLAQIVQLDVKDRAGLAQIDGLGEAKLEKYGERLLGFLEKRGDGTDEKSAGTV